MFQALPLDAVHHILSYDRRFAVKHGKLVEFKKIDVSKYAFLLNLPTKTVQKHVAEVVLPIHSTSFFCLISVPHKTTHGLVLQKVSNKTGKGFFLDYAKHTFV